MDSTSPSPNYSYLNAFSKSTPTISGCFLQLDAGFRCSNGQHQAFQGSLCPLCMAVRHRTTSMGKVGISNKEKGNCQSLSVGGWVMLAYSTCYKCRNQAMAYGCAHSNTCYIRSVTFRHIESEDVSPTGDSSTSEAQH